MAKTQKSGARHTGKPVTPTTTDVQSPRRRKTPVKRTKGTGLAVRDMKEKAGVEKVKRKTTSSKEMSPRTLEKRTKSKLKDNERAANKKVAEKRAARAAKKAATKTVAKSIAKKAGALGAILTAADGIKAVQKYTLKNRTEKAKTRKRK